MHRSTRLYAPILFLTLSACGTDGDPVESQETDSATNDSATIGEGESSEGQPCTECGCPGGEIGFSCPDFDGGACICPSDTDSASGTGGTGAGSGECRVMFEVSGAVDAAYEHSEPGCGSLIGSLGEQSDDFIGLFVGSIYMSIPSIGPSATHESDAVRVQFTELVGDREVEWTWDGCSGAFELAGYTSSINFTVEGSVDCSGIAPEASDAETYQDLTTEYGDLAIAPFDFAWRL